MKEILLPGLLFFVLLTVYNLLISIRRRENFTPAIVSFLVTLAILLFYFEQVLFGVLIIAVSTAVAFAKFSEASKIREKKILQELKKIDGKEPLKLKDFLGWKAWAKIIVKQGAKKAAFFYAMFAGIAIILVGFIVLVIFPDEFRWSFWVAYLIVIVPLFYFDYSRAFEKARQDATKQ